MAAASDMTTTNFFLSAHRISIHGRREEGEVDRDVALALVPSSSDYDSIGAAAAAAELGLDGVKPHGGRRDGRAPLPSFLCPSISRYRSGAHQ